VYQEFGLNILEKFKMIILGSLLAFEVSLSAVVQVKNAEIPDTHVSDTKTSGYFTKEKFSHKRRSTWN